MHILFQSQSPDGATLNSVPVDTPTRPDSTIKGHDLSLDRRPSCGGIRVVRTMRMSVVYLFAFPALVFVAVDGLVAADLPDQPPEPPSGATLLERDMTRRWGGCRCYHWGDTLSNRCWWHNHGCSCKGHCQIKVPHGNHWHWCMAGNSRGRCCCRDNFIGGWKQAMCWSK
ncbi:hypothetical protein LSAT2_010495 [Lamellibrachia satsuma]|nr:hypothetical protein LSAT2_010495 [Lamellibrachia satsuma]